MSAINVNVLVSAKEEYTKQLMKCLVPYFYESFILIFRKSQENAFITYKFKLFQIELKKIPNWNSVTLYEKITILVTKYPYFEDLIKAIFISHVKILGCIRISKTDKEIKLKLPQLDIFIHKLFISIAENFYNEPKVILKDPEFLNIYIETIISDSIRRQIPIQHILQEYLSDVFDAENNFKEKNDDEEGDEDSEEEEEDSEEDEEREKTIQLNSTEEYNNDGIRTAEAEENIPRPYNENVAPQETIPPPEEPSVPENEEKDTSPPSDVNSEPKRDPRMRNRNNDDIPALFNDAKLNRYEND